MPSLISNIEKEAYQVAMLDLHDTFKRPLKVIREGTKTIVSTNPNYNHVYRRSSDQPKIQYEPRENVIEARIKYFDKNSDEVKINAGNNNPLDLILQASRVRLKVTLEDHSLFFDGVERVELDGYIFDVKSEGTPVGLFTPQFKTVYMERVN